MVKGFASRAAVCLLALLGMCASGHAMSRRPSRLTMLVVPARYSVLQVAFDVVRRFPAVLVCYQGDAITEEPLLHAWNGREWVYVSLEDYERASFLQRVPQQAVLVGDEQDLPPILITASAWCPMVMSVPSVDTSTLVNSLGKVFAFRPKDWKWFAARYNLEIQDLNTPRRRESWYDGQWSPEQGHLMPLEQEGKPFPEGGLTEGEWEDELAPVEMIEPEIPAPAEIVPGEDEAEELWEEPASETPARVRLPAPAEPEGWKEEAVATDVPSVE